MTLDPFSMPRLMPLAHAPEVDLNWALFLDFDGTLVDNASTLDAVVVPPDLGDALKAASIALNGALAIVSSRLLADVDRLLAPLTLPAAGEHGATIRMPDGSMDEIDMRIPYEWVQALMDVTMKMEGVVVERKVHGVVAHYRNAPRFEKQLRAVASQLIAKATAFEVIESRMAIEIHPRTVSNVRAVDRFMGAAPFAGRTPVFVGDDVVDLAGFKAVERRGGFGLDVFDHFAGRPQEVRDWLASFADA